MRLRPVRRPSRLQADRAAGGQGWGSGSLATPKAVVNAWMHSSGHRHNILDRRLRDLGVGFVHGTPSASNASGAIYTTDFGLRVK